MSMFRRTEKLPMLIYLLSKKKHSNLNTKKKSYKDRI